MDKTFGEFVRELREKRDLSLRELGRRLGVTAPFLSDIELGRRFPSPELLAEMAPILHTSVEELKRYDTRAPLEALKKRATENPAYGIALRTLIDTGISAEEIMNLAEKKKGKKDK